MSKVEQVPRRAWVLALTPPTAWALHLAVGYLWEEGACPGSPGEEPGGGVLAWLLTGTTAVLAGVTAVAALLAYQAWRRLASVESEGAGGRASARSVESALLLVAAVLGPLFLLTIVLQAAPLLFFGECA